VVAGSKASLLVIWYSWHPCELRKLPLNHLSCLITNPKWDWVIPSAFAWVAASSGTWGSLWLWIFCFSWWLPPPRWLGVAEELWQELVIVLGHLSVIMRGSYAFLGGAPKATLIHCACYWATSLVGRFLRCPMCGRGPCYIS
jgi:hypothetical protein